MTRLFVRAASAATPAPHRSRLTPLLHGVVLFLACAVVHADYQAGLDAYSAGKYKLAMQEWKAVVEQPPTAVHPAIYVETHYAIAKLYWQGQGATRDYYAAYDWLLKAARLGHAGAMAKLGYLYTDGIVVQQDFGQAFEWYSRAAKLGDVDGMYNLGIFYLNGWGTEPDQTLARQYLAAASAQGDQAAEQALQQLQSIPPVVKAASTETAEPQEADTQKEVRTASATTEKSENHHPANESRQTPLLHDETWILAQDPSHYTIQAIGLREREKLVGLLDGHEHLAPFAIYTVQRKTRPIHLLVQGVYPTVEEARAARDAFPRAINRPSQVWIRQFEKIQAIIDGEAQ